ncbi:MAG: RIP metalloprotease RseP [Ruminococcus sp.]|nr:RIP metalloprotease RseP [Ruminococcus sp.]
MGVLTTIALILIAVLLFELIIFVHEGGHFIAAKKSGVKVNEFSLGMGPKLFSFTKGETTYSLRLFPIGGFCAMEGEDEDSENPRAFNNAKIWKRMIIIVAGAFMNIVLGLILMFINLIPQENLASTQISMFSSGSFSAVSGLQEGDQILSVNGYGVNTYIDFYFAMYTMPVQTIDGDEFTVYKEDCAFDLLTYARERLDKMDSNKAEKADSLMVEAIRTAQAEIAKTTTKDEAYKVFCKYCDKLSEIAGQDRPSTYPTIELRETRKRYRSDMTVLRNGEKVELKDVDFMTLQGDDGKPKINMDFYVQPLNKDFGTLLGETFKETVSVVRMVWGGLAGLVTGKFSLNEMSGPVGLAAAITDVASKSLETNGFGSAVNSIVYVMMIITVNLGIVNMLPFPALDGGRFLMLLIEAIFHKPVPRKVESIINTVGLVLLLGLTAVIAVKDIWQIFNGGFNYG